MFEALREKSVTFSIGGTCSAYDKAEGLCLYAQNAPKASGGSQASHINSLVSCPCPLLRRALRTQPETLTRLTTVPPPTSARLIQSACATTRNTFEQKADRSDPELWCGSQKASGGYFN